MNSFSEGWALFKVAIRCALKERAIALGTLLYAVVFMGVSISLSWFKISFAPALHVLVIPLLAYFMCRLHENVVLGTPIDHPLVRNLKSRLGLILIMGVLYAGLNILSAATIKALSAQGPEASTTLAIVVGALINWIFGIILNLALWLMALRNASVRGSLSQAVRAFWSNIKTFISVTAAMLLVMLPGLLFVALQLGLRLLVLQGTIQVGQGVLVGFMIASIAFFALSVICVLALNVFVTYELGRRLFEDAATGSPQ